MYVSNLGRKLATTAALAALAMPMAAMAQPTPSFWDVANMVPGNPVTAAHPWEAREGSGPTCGGSSSLLTGTYSGAGGAWLGRVRATPPNIPMVFRSVSSTTSSSHGITMAAGGVAMRPGVMRCAVIRFTAPADGVYKIAGEFPAPVASQASEPNFVNVRVLDKGTQIAAGAVDKPNAVQMWNWPNSHQFQLQAGQTIDFAVDGGPNGPVADTVQLVGRVTWTAPLGFRASKWDFEGTHGCAIEQGTNILHCWGENGLHQLGINSTSNSNKAVPAADVTTFLASNLLGSIENLQVGRHNGCVRTSAPTNAVVCWGRSQDGESGSTSPVAWPPVNITTQLGPLQSASIEGYDGCLVTPATASPPKVVRCWGHNGGSAINGGNLGWKNGSWTKSHLPLNPVPSVTDAKKVAATRGASGFSCAIFGPSNKVTCWGNTPWNGFGVHGSNGATSLPNPDGIYTTVVKTNATTDLTGVQKILTSGSVACGLKSGALYCWGMNATWGMLEGAPVGGSGGAANLYSYATLMPWPFAAGVSDFAFGTNAICAISGALARVYCQGRNDDGQLGKTPIGSHRFISFNPARAGTGPFANVTVHDVTPVPGLNQMTRIEGGDAAFCAQKSTGELFCWGRGNSGQLGHGATVANSSNPVQVIK